MYFNNNNIKPHSKKKINKFIIITAAINRKLSLHLYFTYIYTIFMYIICTIY